MKHLMFIQKLHAALYEADLNPHSWEIRSLQAIGSTNSRVADMLGLYNKVVVLSQTQSKGRGREQKTWFSPMGGLWMSIGFLTETDPVELSTPVIETVHQVLSNYLENDIKEPNDILVNGKKLCGVLVEGKVQSNKLKQVIVGVGINLVNELPDEVIDIATRMADHITEVPDTHDLASELAVSIIRNLGALIPE